jgi:hypothetical protein
VLTEMLCNNAMETLISLPTNNGASREQRAGKQGSREAGLGVGVSVSVSVAASWRRSSVRSVVGREVVFPAKTCGRIY